MKFIEVNGTALRYELQGKRGQILVLIHEMGGTVENWDLVLPLLDPTYRTLRYDSRGCGLSAKLTGEIDVVTLSDDLRALLDAEGIHEPVVVVGCALGAATALVFAARFPERTAGAVVMSPALDMKPEDRAPRLAMLTGVLRDGMKFIAEGALEAAYPAVLRERDPERFRDFRARWLGNDPASFAAHYRMLIDMDIQAELRAVRCPVLAICGTLDKFRSPAYVRAVLAPLPDVAFVEIETSHHQTVETPQEIAEAMQDFLARRLPASPAQGEHAP